MSFGGRITKFIYENNMPWNLKEHNTNHKYDIAYEFKMT
jgi:hypothetical protein